MYVSTLSFGAVVAILAAIEAASVLCPKKCKCIEVKNKYYIDCSYKNQTSIPRIPTTTILLNMSFNDITMIKDSPFLNASLLEVLDLSYTKLLNISNDGFKGLKSLKYLNISSNEDMPLTNETVPKTLFQDMTRLEELKMYNTTSHILHATYPDEALTKLKLLKELWIDGMTNKSLGPGFKQMRNLKILRFAGDMANLGKCKTDIIHGMFEFTTFLTHLYIRQCDVNVIDKDAFTMLVNLSTLDLSENLNLGLEKASVAFAGLRNTNISVLIMNHIYPTDSMVCGVYITKKIVQTMTNLSLTELRLEQNNIVSVEHNALSLLPPTLEVLGVRNNEFRLQPYVLEVGLMTNLKWIDLSYQFFPNLISFKESYAIGAGIGNKNGYVPSYSIEKKEKCKYCKDAKTKSIDDNSIKLEHDTSSDGNYKMNINQNNITAAPETRLFNNFAEYLKFEIESQKQVSSNLKSLTGHNDEGKLLCHSIPELISILPKLPPKLEYVDISHSKLTHPIFNFSLSSQNNVKQINASRSMLYCWDGPVYGLQKLEHLDLSENLCTRVRKGFFDEMFNIKTLLLQINLIGIDIANDINGRLLEKLSKLEVLDISFNRVRIVQRMFLKAQANLQSLNMSFNLMTEFNLHISHMKNLTAIDLSNNNVATLSVQMTTELETLASEQYNDRRTSLVLNLTDNLIRCNCKNIDFLDWVAGHWRSNLNVVITNCVFENQTMVSIKVNSELRRIIESLKTECESSIPLIVGLVILLMCIVNTVVGIIAYRFRWKIRYWYYVAGRKVRTKRIRTRGGYINMDSVNLYEERHAFKYDAYIASSEDDRSFIFERMKGRLEQKGVRLCIPEIDFVPGQSTYRMIGNAINVSRMTVFVTSSMSIQNREWEIALRMAQEESLNRGRMAYFAVFIEKIPNKILHNRKLIDIKELYRTQAYIDYPTEMDDEAVLTVFWEDCVNRIKQQSTSQNSDYLEMIHDTNC